MRAIVIAMLAAATVAGPAWAEGSHFERDAKYVGESRMSLQSAEWIVLLPTLADQCEMKIDKGHLQVLVHQFPDESHDLTYLIEAKRRGYPSHMAQDWDELLSENKPQACKVVDRLWGEDGDQFPGVLKKR